MDKEYIIDLRGVYSREELHDRIEEELEKVKALL